LEGTLALMDYVNNGGTLVALDEASDHVIDQFSLSVENVAREVPRSVFFIPGSIVQIAVNTSHPVGYGMPEEVAASFVRSLAFSTVCRSNLQEGERIELASGPNPPVEVVARYAEENILLSDWALGEEEHIGGKAASPQSSPWQGIYGSFWLPTSNSEVKLAQPTKCSLMR